MECEGSVLLPRTAPAACSFSFRLDHRAYVLAGRQFTKHTHTEGEEDILSRASAVQRTLQGLGSCLLEEQWAPLGGRQSGDLALCLPTIAAERAQPGQGGGCWQVGEGCKVS